MNLFAGQTNNIYKGALMFRSSFIILFVLSLWLVTSAQVSSIIGDESQKFTGPWVKPVPLQPSAVTSPGFMVGETDYDWPCNGGGRKNICRSPTGGYHFYWTWRPEANQNKRRAFYRYYKPPNIWSEPIMIDSTNGRMGALAQLEDGRAVATAHATLDTLVGHNYSFLYIDSAEGAGKFQAIQLPLLGLPDSAGNIVIDSSDQPIWPNVAITEESFINKIILVTACQGTRNVGWWTISDDLGETWLPWSDTLAGCYLDGNSWSGGGREVLVARDKRMAILNGPVLNNPNNLKLCYFETKNEGRKWTKDTICEFLPPDSLTPANDSVLPYVWYSGVYDDDEVLHVAYVALDTTAGGGGGGQGGSGWRSQIRYWNSSTRTSSIVMSAWWATNPGPGVNHPTVSEAQIAIDRTSGYLYVTWTQANTNDVSQGGFVNLDLYTAMSTDNGATWIYRQNMTNSQSPAAAAGKCDNDEWHSIAEEASNGVIDIFYMNDKDAGSSVNDATVITVNPMNYMKYVISPTAVKPNKIVSRNALRITMYPNPFRNRIEIKLADKNLAASKGKKKARLSIFGTNGRLIREISFKKKYLWNGTDAFGNRLPAGIYLLQVEFNSMKHSSSIVLMK